MVGASKKGLGKGLSALMSEDYSNHSEESQGGGGLRHLPLHALEPGKYQPRRQFDETALAELAASIMKNGIMQPLVVRPLGGDRYEIVAGERRWRAAKYAKLAEVPAVVREIDDRQALELALIENIQRQDLNPLEESMGYQRLIDQFGYSQEALAITVGKSRSHVANLLRLNSLPPVIKAHLEAGRLSMGHARALLNVPNADALAEKIVKDGLSVRQTEQLCRQGGLVKASRRSPSPASAGAFRAKDPDILALEETLSENLGLSVSIEDDGQQGRLTIAYTSLSQLDDILKRLGGAV